MRSRELTAEDTEYAREIDLRALGRTLRRRRHAILIPTLLALAGMTVFVNVVTPRYTGESQVLLENQETFFTRPDRVNQPEQLAPVDQEGVASQVQLVQSPDIARRAIEELHLIGNPEFDPTANMNPLSRVLILLGLKRDPTKDTVEARVTQAFLERLTVFSPPKTRVISIQFASKDPALAAQAANVVARLYIEAQSSAKRAMAKDAADALAAQIADLRTRLATADAERERYRSQTGLLSGSNNMTITGQQLADLNADLTKARSEQADDQAKAQMIRQLLRAGKAADVPDVINNDIVRRVSEQRATAQASLAFESQTLLPEHPRVKSLRAQVEQYDLALKAAAKQAAISLENQAMIAGTRVANLQTMLGEQKKEVGSSNFDEVHLRALERTTQSLKDQLESSMAKYQEAQARQESNATPADARMITRAHEPEDPSFPKKLPFIAFATVAALVFSSAFVAAGELLSRHPESDAPEPLTPAIAEPPRVPTRRPRRMPDVSAPLAEVEESGDLVFAPVPEPRRRASAAGPSKSSLAGKLGRMAAALAYLKGFGRSAAESRVLKPVPTGEAVEAGVGWDETSASPAVAPAVAPTSRPGEDETLADRIVAAHVPGRGLHVVATSLGNETATAARLIELSRILAGRGRSILVDLNRMPTKLAPLCDGDGRAAILTMSGLAELLSGDSSFAEVIYRDVASRLHFVPAGRQEANFRDFDLILDALSETYDFVVLLAPSLPQSEIAKVMAPYADFVVIAAEPGVDEEMLALLEKEIVEAGARQVLVAGVGSPPMSVTQNVA